jgi:hypothetical protein
MNKIKKGRKAVSKTFQDGHLAFNVGQAAPMLGMSEMSACRLVAKRAGAAGESIARTDFLASGNRALFGGSTNNSNRTMNSKSFEANCAPLSSLTLAER